MVAINQGFEDKCLREKVKKSGMLKDLQGIPEKLVFALKPPNKQKHTKK
jgi:hypothetical protein